MSTGSTIVVEGLEVENKFSGNHDNQPQRPIQCFTCYKQGHRYVDYPYKDRTDLNFCTRCGMGDHSLEYCPTMLDKINKNKYVNVLSCVHEYKEPAHSNPTRDKNWK